MEAPEEYAVGQIVPHDGREYEVVAVKRMVPDDGSEDPYFVETIARFRVACGVEDCPNVFDFRWRVPFKFIRARCDECQALNRKLQRKANQHTKPKKTRKIEVHQPRFDPDKDRLERMLREIADGPASGDYWWRDKRCPDWVGEPIMKHMSVKADDVQNIILKLERRGCIRLEPRKNNRRKMVVAVIVKENPPT